ncbi:Cd(II)/Pb(II)-responsive transcriptional regulator [Acinetobacter sp. R933-2]|uniref:Cd(II)/Pb(II)-responsive transcriptional regulator n=1 Tax=Acinetobacter sp. R933-2 TaxID=2746728 RepID=UPI00257663BD|nr:Cd(II)/Pb(II)-responsive transcriptional regulator [Acinetobacter sp. R933-2]MDM1247274.1 Cd(II)/Pb(II)-responsive transcriptional regulator [Acinetobacter sp. R933-2]
MKTHYLIKDLALKTGLSSDTIRFYEKRKLLQPSFRAANNYRYYDENSIKRLIFIKRCRALDISLSEIQTLIELEQNPNQSCEKVNVMIEDHIQQVTDKIDELIKFQSQLIQLRASCPNSQSIHHCEILKQLEAENY